MNEKHFGQVLKRARKRLGMTQWDLSKKVGCARTTVCDWENEKYLPTDAKNIAALEQALELPNGELYSLIYGHLNPTAPAEDTPSKGL